ncbi:MAG: ferric reductase-like transmembrane domain-containing protein [Anaerolineales bacterium]|nr:ferric reductase-like transmembrane domain-containing protein [Anaerolineales bacterium]MCB8990072.1 ferric reductase-like transmembrane domain-containing protein [Ardenticatenaceae bacterium]
MTSSSETRVSPSLQKPIAIFFGLIVALIGGSVLLVSLRFAMTAVPVGSQISSILNVTSKTPWYFSRAAGTVAYLLLAGSTVWGLLLSSKIIKEAVPAALALAMHNILSWLAITLTGLHALALLFDTYYTYTLADLTIPFIGPYQPGWVGLGIIGLYAMLVTSISFSFRKQIGQKRWRQLHYLTFVAFLFATLHGAMAGTDSGNPGMTAMYWGSGILVLFLTNYRLLTNKRAR